MNQLPESRLRKLLTQLRRLVDNIYFWGLLGWTLILLRYAAEVIHPRYGG